MLAAFCAVGQWQGGEAPQHVAPITNFAFGVGAGCIDGIPDMRLLQQPRGYVLFACPVLNQRSGDADGLRRRSNYQGRLDSTPSHSGQSVPADDGRMGWRKLLSGRRRPAPYPMVS